ncbi:MAG: uroporphyrinogen decarboxylase family protein [Lachnospiraceae bacterium]|nr:uroporphyrinogen decarboxylase family protein [Lachnospiraceae bacterium]
MLTKRQNLLETIRGGHPDRFVNQYEAFHLIYGNPFTDLHNGPVLEEGVMNATNAWGITFSWPEGHPGEFPEHDEEHIAVKDITKWKEQLQIPEVVYPAEEWEPYIKEAEAVDRNEQFVTACVWPGIFEQCHHLMSLPEAMINFYEEPEAMHELIECLTEWELRYSDEICKYLKPEAVFHHDDWGSQLSTFISPEMFEEFFLPAYKKIYKRYRDHGVKLVIHHSDSYAATLVPYMIEMGVDIWQGAMSTNDIPELIKKYGGKISFMSGIDSAWVDYPGWTQERVREVVRKVCGEHGKLYFIPCATQGLDVSTFPGVYEAVTEEIEAYNKEAYN